jgi:hypothetical protein
MLDPNTTRSLLADLWDRPFDAPTEPSTPMTPAEAVKFRNYLAKVASLTRYGSPVVLEPEED